MIIYLVAQVQNVLRDMSKDEFRKKYRREKPEAEVKIVFTCRSGRRSAQAAQTANKLGYKKYSQNHSF